MYNKYSCCIHLISLLDANCERHVPMHMLGKPSVEMIKIISKHEFYGVSIIYFTVWQAIIFIYWTCTSTHILHSLYMDKTLESYRAFNHKSYSWVVILWHYKYLCVNMECIHILSPSNCNDWEKYVDTTHNLANFGRGIYVGTFKRTIDIVDKRKSKWWSMCRSKKCVWKYMGPRLWIVSLVFWLKASVNEIF